MKLGEKSDGKNRGGIGGDWDFNNYQGPVKVRKTTTTTNLTSV